MILDCRKKIKKQQNGGVSNKKLKFCSKTFFEKCSFEKNAFEDKSTDFIVTNF